MTPSHTNKRGVRYRYYVSRRLITGAAAAEAATPSGAKAATAHSAHAVTVATTCHGPTGQRIPAAKLETLVTDRMRALLGNVGVLQDLARERPVPEQHALVLAAGRLAVQWPDLSQPQQRQILQAVITRIDVHAEQIEIAVNGATLLHWLIAGTRSEAAESTATKPMLSLVVPVGLKRVGLEMRLMLPGETAGPDPDASLGRLIARAHRIRERLTGDLPLSIDEVARGEGLTRSYTTRLLRLSYLGSGLDQHQKAMTAASARAEA